MVQYRRSRLTGGTFFFTVNLRDRRRAFLVEHVDALRLIIRDVHKELPFTIDAMVVLPDHWHSVWTLPSGMPFMRGEYDALRHDLPDTLCVTA